MRIGIITIHNSPSYGGSLQAFALYKFLEQRGYNVEIIDLHRPYQDDYQASSRYKLYAEFSLKSFIKENLRKILCHKKRSPSAIGNHYSEIAFEKFSSFNGMLRYSKAYLGCDSLYENPPMYDVYITGSDQVWNPYQPYCIEPYFLTFAPKGKKRIAYAASIGLDCLPLKMEKLVSSWLKDYDKLAVREQQTADYLKSLTGLEITTVSDPTFLLDSDYWKSIAVVPSKKGYILMFTLSYNSSVLDYCKKLSAESERELISIRMKQSEYSKSAGYTAITDAGPAEFIGYMANAELVITDSFHGTVFAFLMGANNVFTYISEGNKRGVRIVNLYNELGYSNHILRGNLVHSYEALEAMNIDKKKVRETIKDMTNTSRQFLLDSLNE